MKYYKYQKKCFIRNNIVTKLLLVNKLDNVSHFFEN